MAKRSYVASNETQPLKVERYTPHIGGAVHDLDLRRPLDRATQIALRAALVEHQVLFFRNQNLSPDAHIALDRVFGDTDKAKALFPAPRRPQSD